MNFVEEVQLIIDNVICVVFAAVGKDRTGRSLTQNVHSLQHFILKTAGNILKNDNS